jgi:predicted flap endonuclease-1-like 5' DNA nuclease
MTANKVLRLVRGYDFPAAASQPLGRVTISGGVAAFPDHAGNSSELLEAADRALYRAKERGRDRVLVARRLVDGAEAPTAAAVVEPEGDDLQRIKGIGPTFETALKEIGISTYRQVAELNWTRMVLVASRLNSFPERIVRDRWLQQARELHRQTYGEEL